MFFATCEYVGNLIITFNSTLSKKKFKRILFLSYALEILIINLNKNPFSKSRIYDPAPRLNLY